MKHEMRSFIDQTVFIDFKNGGISEAHLDLKFTGKRQKRDPPFIIVCSSYFV